MSFLYEEEPSPLRSLPGEHTGQRLSQPAASGTQTRHLLHKSQMHYLLSYRASYTQEILDSEFWIQQSKPVIKCMTKYFAFGKRDEIVLLATHLIAVLTVKFTNFHMVNLLM